MVQFTMYSYQPDQQSEAYAVEDRFEMVVFADENDIVHFVLLNVFQYSHPSMTNANEEKTTCAFYTPTFISNTKQLKR